MKMIVFLLLFPFNSIAQDALLEAMFKDWDSRPPETEEIDDRFLDDDSEAEVYHWKLGNPDNIPEIEIIYDEPSPCGLSRE